MIDLAASPVPLLGFVAASGTGKTTLLKALIPLLKAEGLRTGVIKHSHHAFAIDQPGKDSYELRTAGASPVMLSSANRRAVIMEWPDSREPDLAAELDFFPLKDLDLVLIEGFKNAPIAKLEVHRPSLGASPLFFNDDRIVAIATDKALRPKPAITELDLNQPAQIARYIRAIHLSRDGA
jgi:molybdopterin-guanine dinucleotide biosynthesis adapter protein